MKSKEQILQQLGWTVDNGDNKILFDLIISQAMDIWAEQQASRHCNCSDEDKHGETAVMCCNRCGKPTEKFWQSEKK